MNQSKSDYIDMYVMPPDELSLCDEEIRAVFLNTCYMTGSAIMAQHAKELRLFRELLQKVFEK